MTPFNPHDEASVTLYHYDELTAEERAAMEAHLETCAACRQTLDELRGLARVVPHAPALDPSPEVLTALRGSVMAQTAPTDRALMGRVPARRPANDFARVMSRLAVACLLVAAGVALGTWWNEPAPLLVATAPPVPGGPSVWPASAEAAEEPPALASIYDVRVDPATGLIEVAYQAVQDVTVQGRTTDPAIRRLLQQALLDEENPAARLYAARALFDAQPEAVAPDSALVETLVYLLEEEANEGIRLHALQALRKLHATAPLGPMVKHALLDVLTSDANSALRIEALETLTAGSLAERDLQVYLQQATDDENTYIRGQARQLLGGTLTEDAAGPLEMLPGDDPR